MREGKLLRDALTVPVDETDAAELRLDDGDTVGLIDVDKEGDALLTWVGERDMHAEGVSDTEAVLEEDGGGLREKDSSPEPLREVLKQNEADLDAAWLRLPEGDLLALATTELERETLGDEEVVPEGGRWEGDTEPVREMEPPVELLRDADEPAENDRDTDGLGEADASAVGVTEVLVTTVAEGLTKGAAV